MTDKLTDKDIVKALECCGRNSIAGWLNDCKNCPLNDRTTCIPELMYKSKDLINRLQAENERLNIRLRKERDQFADIGKMYSEIKAEAYKEFAERLKEDAAYYSNSDGAEWFSVDVADIDNLLKEMVGDGGETVL